MEDKNGKRLWIRGLVLCAAIGAIVAAKARGNAQKSKDIDISQ